MSHLESILTKALESCQAAYAAIRTGQACGDAQHSIMLVDEALRLVKKMRSEVPAPQGDEMIIATLTLTMDDTGRVNVEGPLGQQAQCYAMLQLGMDVVRAHNQQPTQGLDAPGVVLIAEPGEPASEPEIDKHAGEWDHLPPESLAMAPANYPNDALPAEEREAAEQISNTEGD